MELDATWTHGVAALVCDGVPAAVATGVGVIEEDVSCLAAHTGRHLVRVHGPPLHGTVSCTHGRGLPKHSHGRAVCGVRAVGVVVERDVCGWAI